MDTEESPTTITEMVAEESPTTSTEMVENVNIQPILNITTNDQTTEGTSTLITDLPDDPAFKTPVSARNMSRNTLHTLITEVTKQANLLPLEFNTTEVYTQMIKSYTGNRTI